MWEIMIFPNQFPTKQTPRRIAIIGDCVGKSELAWHVCHVCGSGYEFSGICLKCQQDGHLGYLQARPSPFVGPTGKLLNALLDEVGIDRAACYIGNVAQVLPPHDQINAFKWGNEEIQGGLRQLKEDLAQYQPHMIFCLGAAPLRAFRGEPGGIKEWRGSLFIAHKSSPYPGIKCLGTQHPQAILRDWALRGISRFDYRRLAKEMRTDELVLPGREILVDLSKEEIIQRLRDIQRLGLPIWPDIEGTIDHVSCVGFGYDSLHAFVVPIIHVDGTSWWSEEDELELWEAMRAVLEDPGVPKGGQNLAYDAYVLAWSYGIVISPIKDDTMFKHWECFPEFEKRLGFMASHLTREPYYKFQRKKAKEMDLDEDGGEVVEKEL